MFAFQRQPGKQVGVVVVVAEIHHRLYAHGLDVLHALCSRLGAAIQRVGHAVEIRQAGPGQRLGPGVPSGHGPGVIIRPEVAAADAHRQRHRDGENGKAEIRAFGESHSDVHDTWRKSNVKGRRANVQGSRVKGAVVGRATCNLLHAERIACSFRVQRVAWPTRSPCLFVRCGVIGRRMECPTTETQVANMLSTGSVPVAHETPDVGGLTLACRDVIMMFGC